MSLVEKYNNAPTKQAKLAVKEQIETLKNTFNKNSGGYLNDVDINYGTKTVKIKDKTPEIYKTSKEDTYAQILKNVKHSNTYFKNKGMNDRILQGDQFNKFQRDLKNRINANQNYKSLAIGVPTIAVATQFLSGEATAEIKPQGSPGQLNPETEEGFTTGQKVAGTAAAGVGAYKFGKPLLKGVGKAASALFGPVGVAASYPALGMLGEEYKTDLSRPLDRVVLGAELAGAKGIVSGAQNFRKGIKNPLLRKIAGGITSISPKYALKAARVASPLGIASLAGEGLYHLGKAGVAEKRKLNAMTDREREDYMRSEIDPLMDEGGMLFND